MDFVTFDIAKKLKERGFKLACIGHYEGDRFEYNTYDGYGINISYIARSYNDDDRFVEYTDVPVICQVLKWLREEKKISVQPLSTRGNRWESQITFTDENDKKLVEKFLDGSFWAGRRSKTYEEAALAGIQYVIDNLI